MDFSAPGALMEWSNLIAIPAEAETIGLLSCLLLLFFMWIVWNGADAFEYGLKQLDKLVFWLLK